MSINWVEPCYHQPPEDREIFAIFEGAVVDVVHFDECDKKYQWKGKIDSHVAERMLYWTEINIPEDVE